MAHGTAIHDEPPGPIAHMAGNGIAANLLMWGIVAAGLLSLSGIVMQAWSHLPFDTIEVSVPFPGASPEEAVELVIVKVEEQVRGIKDVKSVRSVAGQGVASILVEMMSDADMSEALDAVKSAVGRIDSFPAAVENPSFRELTNRRSILRLILHGNISERSLKELGYHIENQLESLPEVSWVEASGTRDYEVSIEVPLHRLRAFGMTLEDVADAVRRNSLDLSAGSIETQEAQVRVRTFGQRYSQRDFEDIIVLGGPEGTEVRLGDIADVRDGFASQDLLVRHQNEPAIFIEVFRADREKVDEVAEAARTHLESQIIPSLPPGVGLTIWNDESKLFDKRVEILLKNGALGLLLVFAALTLFLEIRLALWVCVGLLVSGTGTLAVLLALDQPIHADVLLAFVLAIGIVVDDAIVVSEHIHHERQQGSSGLVAAIRGARRIKTPLILAVFTSVAAFSPILFLPGGIGDILFPTGVVLVSMLLISLIESLLILPNHLSHLPGPEWVPTHAVDRFLRGVHTQVDSALQQFLKGPLHRSLQLATMQPKLVIACAFGLLILSVSLLPAGIVRTTFTPQVEDDYVSANLEMPDGTPAERTYEVAREIEAAGHRAIDRLTINRREDDPPLLSGVMLTVGKRARNEGGGLVALPSLNPESHFAVIEFKLLSAEQREISTTELADAWREEVGFLPYVRGISFVSEVVALGAPIEVELAHPEHDRLNAAALSVMESLRGLGGVFDVRSNHSPGVPEIQLKLRPHARTLGLTVQDLARQVRAAYFGQEAVRIQRGREDVRVFVRLPERERDAITDVESYLVRTPSGSEVPLSEVAELGLGTSAPEIVRKNGERIATITADVDIGTISGAEAIDFITKSSLEPLTAEDPELSYYFAGAEQQNVESFDGLTRAFALALLAIFALLAIALRSYPKPLIIMSVIPFGLIGVIVGHLLLGLPFGFISVIGFVGLSGVVINDSLVMLDFVQEKMLKGDEIRTAIIEGAKERFRPIMLTSVTTFLGFSPLIFEPSVHGKFLVPFSAAIGLGILFTTVVIMMLVPALLAIFHRVNASTG